MFGQFAAQVKGIRGADAQVKTLKDLGEYDVWSKICLSTLQAGELLPFAYGVGGNVPGSGAAAGTVANKLDTNLRVANQFVDESMSVYAIAIQIERVTAPAFQAAGMGGASYTTTLADWEQIEAHTLFRMHVGGDKPFAEGMICWFPEAGGPAGSTQVNNAEIITNGVATVHSARKWDLKLPIGRIEKFWGEFSWLRATLVLAGAAGGCRVGVITRLMGVRARGVQ